MDRETAVMMWREACGKHAVDANMPPTGRMLETFARRVEAAATEYLRTENSTFRNAQRACEHCDPSGQAAALVAECGRLRHDLAQIGKLAEDRLQQMTADRAEFVALRSKISSAPVAIMDTRDVLGLCAPTEADFPAIYALQGRRVALVDMGPNV